MKKLLTVSLLALSLMGLTACASSGTAVGGDGQEQSGIEGVDKIQLRYEKIPGNANSYIYCLDSVAYLETPTGVVATPQYDSLCDSKR